MGITTYVLFEALWVTLISVLGKAILLVIYFIKWNKGSFRGFQLVFHGILEHRKRRNVGFIPTTMYTYSDYTFKD